MSHLAVDGRLAMINGSMCWTKSILIYSHFQSRSLRFSDNVVGLIQLERQWLLSQDVFSSGAECMDLRATAA